MHTTGTGRPFYSFSAAWANSLYRIALLHGPSTARAVLGLKGPHVVVRWRNIGVRSRVIWAEYGASEHHRPVSLTPTLVSGPGPFGASGLAMRARKRKVLRPDRGPVAKARSPPARSACLFPAPSPKESTRPERSCAGGPVRLVRNLQRRTTAHLDR